MFEIKMYIYAGKKCLMNHRHAEFWSKIISKKKEKKCIVFISNCLLAKYKKEKKNGIQHKIGEILFMAISITLFR